MENHMMSMTIQAPWEFDLRGDFSLPRQPPSHWILKDISMFIKNFVHRRVQEFQETAQPWPPLLHELILLLLRAAHVFQLVPRDQDQTLLSAAALHPLLFDDVLRDLSWCLQEVFASQSLDKEEAVRLGAQRIVRLALTERHFHSMPLIFILAGLHTLASVAIQTHSRRKGSKVPLWIEPEAWNISPLVLPAGLNLDEHGEIKFLEDLGEGAHGKVYKGSWRNEEVAVKEVPNDSGNQLLKSLIVADARTLTLGLDREIRVLNRFKHPNIVRMKGYTENVSVGKYGLVMELMATSLEDFMSAQGKGPPFNDLVMIDILLQIARGMRFLHKSGVMHRDLKPANVLIGFPSDVPMDAGSLDYLAVKLADFGLSKLHDPLLDGTGNHTGMQGTRFYMAPEVLRKSSYSRQADVFSFGTVCLSVAVGPRHAAKKFGKFYENIDAGNLGELLIDCPAYLAPLIKRCWDTDPRRRPSFSAICRDMEKMKQCAFRGWPPGQWNDEPSLDDRLLEWSNEGRSLFSVSSAIVGRRWHFEIPELDGEGAGLFDKSTCETLLTMIESVVARPKLHEFFGRKFRRYVPTMENAIERTKCAMAHRLVRHLRRVGQGLLNERRSCGIGICSKGKRVELGALLGDIWSLKWVWGALNDSLHVDHHPAGVQKSPASMAKDLFAKDLLMRWLLAIQHARALSEDWFRAAQDAILGPQTKIEGHSRTPTCHVCPCPSNALIIIAYNLCATDLHDRL